MEEVPSFLSLFFLPAQGFTQKFGAYHLLIGPHHAFLSWGCQVGLPSPVYEGLASCAHTETQSLSSMGPQMSTWAFFQAAEPHTYPCGPLPLGVL